MSTVRASYTAFPAVIFIFSLAIAPVSLQTVTLFKDKNFGDKKCDITVKGCQPVCDGFKNKASSIQGDADCAHFYRREDCKGYMGTWYKNGPEMKDFKNTDAQDAIMSVGDCKQPIPENTVTFYQHKNFGGQSCSLVVNGCTRMCPDLEKQASSVEGNAVCLKTYSDSNCNDYVGDVFDLKLGGYTNFKEFPAASFASLQDKISSVKPCSNTTVTFFELSHKRGKSCTLQLKGCQPMCPELNNRAKSISGQTTCVKMWSEPGCKGTSNNWSAFTDTSSKNAENVASFEDCVTTDGDKSTTKPLNIRRPTTGGA
nr:PREDICTED: uncharacterized protein LOC109030850 [Bemisia tabaci]